MDPFTHGLVGAMASQSLANKEKIRPAAATGFIAAMLADLDTFIHLPSDPLFNVEVHRQFTHSLFFIPAGALVACGVLWWLMKKHLTFKELYLYSFAAYATSGLLDACTSYGTMLLWPFSETRFAWNHIPVVDPLLTVGLAICVGIALSRRKKTPVWPAWGWLLLLLCTGWIQQGRAMNAAYELAGHRGHRVERIVVKPTIGNQILWRSTYETNGRIYADGIRPGIFSTAIIYEGESAPAVVPERDFAEFKETTLYSDLQRFSRLSEGYLIRHPEKPHIIGDARYSMLPTSLTPLWGVEISPEKPEKHLPFRYFRDAGKEIRRPFKKMVLGRPLIID